MRLDFIEVVAYNYDNEGNVLRQKFMKALQSIIDNGGSVITIVKDDIRVKAAYVLSKD